MRVKCEFSVDTSISPPLQSLMRLISFWNALTLAESVQNLGWRSRDFTLSCSALVGELLPPTPQRCLSRGLIKPTLILPHQYPASDVCVVCVCRIDIPLTWIRTVSEVAACCCTPEGWMHYPPPSDDSLPLAVVPVMYRNEWWATPIPTFHLG